jgi:7,8-dihydroneopterin aldolase/epimerase/oxygenase
MRGLLTIELKQLRFFAYHGLYKEEQKIGNDFEVDLLVSYNTSEMVTDISDTINYVTLYEIVKEEMKKTTELLETLVMTITGRIREKFPQAVSIDISIYKLTPPIAKFPGKVGAKYKWSRE